MMRHFPTRLILLASVLMLTTTACTRRGHVDDPAYGGFFRGIENINDGTYDARVATREQKVAALQARQQRIMAERNSLQRQISGQQNALARLKHDLLVAKVSIGEDNLDSGTLTQINQALAAQPEGQSDAERLASLQKTIADTRKLADRLAALAS
jgi:hypothetical protein